MIVVEDIVVIYKAIQLKCSFCLKVFKSDYQNLTYNLILDLNDFDLLLDLLGNH